MHTYSHLIKSTVRINSDLTIAREIVVHFNFSTVLVLKGTRVFAAN